MQSLLTLGGRITAKLVEQVADFTPGRRSTRSGLVDGHRVAAFICYEAIFPDLVRDFAARGAELLVNITNDAWYGRTSAPHQHLAMAAFRAVENGKYLVRAANTGISAVVDPRGRVLAAHGALRADACSCGTCPSCAAAPSTRATATSSPGPAWAWPRPRPSAARFGRRPA